MSHTAQSPSSLADAPPPVATPHTAWPPGPPRRWWGIPTMRAMARDYLAYSDWLRREHGPVTHVQLLNEHVVDVFDPALVRTLLVDEADSHIRWERGIAVFAQLMGQSVLTTEGATWQRQRRMLAPPFSARRVAEQVPAMVAATAPTLRCLVPAGQAQATVNMDALFTRLTMDVIIQTLVGEAAAGAQCGLASDEAAWAVQAVSEGAFREMLRPMTLPDWLPLPGKATKRRALRILRELVQGLLRQAGSCGGLIGQLRALRDEHSGQPLSEQELFDQCMVSFQAGHETTATALLWWSHLVATHPPVQQRLQAELDGVLAGRTVQAEDFARLPWLVASLKEAMRLYPPVAGLMTRRLTQPVQLGPWRLPARTMVRVTPWVMHRDAAVWAQPQVFDPQRFMPGAPSAERGSYLPFGTGPRVCLGQHFAMLEMGMVAATMLQGYHLQPLPGAPAPQPVLRVTLRPSQPLHLIVQRR